MPRRSYTVQYKLSVLKWHRDNQSSKKATAKHFDLSRARVQEWFHKEQELLANRRGKSALKRRIGEPSVPPNDQLDEIVIEYLEDERENGRPVNNEDLMAFGRIKARELGLVNFKASSGWLRNWKKRMNVGYRRGTNDAQFLPEHYADLCSDFQREVIRKRREFDVTMHNLANMDETCVRFDMAPSCTNNVRGERSVRISTTGGAKRGFTVALAARANGEKLPAFVIFKERNGIVPQRVVQQLQVPRNVRYTASHSGWMTNEKMEIWLNRTWGDDIDDVRRFLILDRASVHTSRATRDKLEDQNTEVTFIPAGCTSLLQPADVSWNRPFKNAIRTEYSAWRREDHRTPAGNLQVCIFFFFS